MAIRPSRAAAWLIAVFDRRWSAPSCLCVVVMVACGSLAVGPSATAAGLPDSEPAERRAGETSVQLDILSILNADDDGFDRVLGPRALVFPADHGPHPTYRSEWWYFSGNLSARDGREFGFQLTFFRFALQPLDVPRASAWSTNQIYLAHFAISDIDGGEFHTRERFSRGALTLAGARVRPFSVWLEDWSVESSDDTFWPLRLSANDSGLGLELQLRRGKARVLNGQSGFSRKGDRPGNASHYYSYPRIAAQGTVHLNGQLFAVTGLAWLDREWSTSSLEDGQVGWDWFALQLGDGREVMFYRLRRGDGLAVQHNAGVLIAGDGKTTALGNADVDIRATSSWESPRSGARYPSSWQFRIPAERLDLQIVPLLADQEWNVMFRYWEGAVRVSGSAAGRPITGRGYVELVGYE